MTNLIGIADYPPDALFVKEEDELAVKTAVDNYVASNNDRRYDLVVTYRDLADEQGYAGGMGIELSLYFKKYMGSATNQTLSKIFESVVAEFEGLLRKSFAISPSCYNRDLTYPQ